MTAARLRALHVPGTPVVLPNAWDADTARAVVEAGFPVVATSSVAVAASLGYSDGECAPADEMLAAAHRIARAVEVPVTVDAESGYGLPPAELAGRLLDAGISGLNIEDTDHRAGSRRHPDQQAELLSALREAAGDELVINARIDSFLSRGGSVDERALVPEVLDRARRYLEAGADVVYPIHVRDAEVIRTITSELAPAAVNVTLLPDGPSLAELTSLRVARVSLGGGLRAVAAEAVRTFLADLAGQRLA
ncbi:isocitrate lyase/PEP mutase family protein [Saccharomonospora xinjiangensis]|uniref:PEP phosphonomutase-like enzyme n=1 Tax=Saccharomonospora xinjiangensis XJ-54 TaxID=882086 RepID=I0V5X3_9PSEU|nr:isocitrate lyase/phosphoenolpyruvate mutase family protein [Saccharomonospora xinjiangensis]EID55526.1 PEP phosphonomutase-like enzyme [Saccharomonospora xinjiangensis XJ-54]